MELKPQMVVVESPFAGDFQRNFRYVLWVQRALWEAGFEPLASHTNCPWYADDANPEERGRGMAWKWAWATQVPHVFAMDLGESSGMVAAARKCAELHLGMECINLARDFPEHWERFMEGEWPPHTRGIQLVTQEQALSQRLTGPIPASDTWRWIGDPRPAEIEMPDGAVRLEPVVGEQIKHTVHWDLPGQGAFIPRDNSNPDAENEG
jgi:hypothetical protein